jgi:1,4-dihydroxy-2-naphthoyl-CoA hydrolase
MPNPPMTHTFTVRLHDTDAAGVLFFAHLFRHAHDAYEGFMAALGQPLDGLLRDGCRLPLVHAEADYLQPIRHGEEIRVTVSLAALGETSFTLDYGFQDFSGEVRARARTVHVQLAEKSGGAAGAASISGHLREALSAARDELARVPRRRD